MIEKFQIFKTFINDKASDFSQNLYGNDVGENIYKEIVSLLN